MRISYRWLQDYVDIKDISVAEVAEMLTMLGIEVEAAYDLGMLSGKIRIARIETIEPHPNADNLVICKVEAGEERLLNIVCGAKNMQPGDKVPLALPGAMLPNGMLLNKACIRGITSEGMLCSGTELMWNEDASGLLILPPEMPVGEPFDTLFEIKVTPNRPDCLSMVGIARELAAKLHRTLHLPVPRFNETTIPVENIARVSIKAWDGCPRYTARVIRQVKIAPSPPWLAHRLEAAGLRPINNVVDVTNYVLLELGHPLHAFDLDKIADHYVIIRWASEGEKIQTLDGVTRELTGSDLVIADPKKPIALAGIMGCGNSEISESTVNVLLECAYFNPTTIRRTAKRLEMQTEASYRFERGTDREKMVLALERATQLIKELTDGEVPKGYIDIFVPQLKKPAIGIEVKKLNSLLGIELSNREIADNLARLGFELVTFDRERLAFNVPSHRIDISRDVDLIEEVARLYGYEKIPATLPYIQSKPATPDPLERIVEKMQRVLLGTGFSETINYSFISARQLKSLGFSTQGLVELLNPISQEQDVMRPTLIVGLINNFIFNFRRDLFDLQLFEIGASYHQGETPSTTRELLWLVAGISGNIHANWYEGRREVNFYDIKGVAQNLLEVAGITRYQVEPATGIHWLHPGKSAQLVYKNEKLCWFGELHPALSRQLELERRIYLLEMPLFTIGQLAEPLVKFTEIPRYPAIARDLAFVVDENITSQQIERIIRKYGKELVEKIQVFDVYRGGQIPPGKKSMAYNIVFRAKDRTLSDEEVNKLQEQIVAEIKTQLGATLR